MSKTRQKTELSITRENDGLKTQVVVKIVGPHHELVDALAVAMNENEGQNVLSQIVSEAMEQNIEANEGSLLEDHLLERGATNKIKN